MRKKSKKDIEKDTDRYTNNGRVVLIGLVGGLLWSLLGYGFFLLNFSKYGPELILSWVPETLLKNGAVKQFLGILVLTILSIIVAFIYKWTLGKVKSMWISIGFGVILWVIVFYILQPWIPKLAPVTQLGWDTLTTTLCLFALYGLFVGYSISFDLTTIQETNYSNE